MIYCNKCGAGLQSDEAFCPECGTPTVNAEAQQSSSTVQAPVNMTQIEDMKFFTFTRPLMDAIDHGKFFKQPFRWLYIVFSIVCLLIPVAFLILLIENNAFDHNGFSTLLLWLFVTFAGWVGFQLWWNRKSKINRYVEKGDDFLATPTFSHFIQTLGEWYGITIAIIGFGVSFCALIASNDGYNRYGGGFSEYVPGMGRVGLLGLILFPLLGFFIVVFFRVIAEGIRALAAIANNTKKKD
jgi:hypothetical protein